VTSRPLPRSAPSAQGVAATGVAAFVDALETLPGLDPHGVVLVRHGHVVAEGWWAPYTADQVHLLYSLSKSFTSTAVALAVAEGLLDLDDTVLGHFPELDAEVTDPRARRMRVRHVAAMASGHHEEALDRADALDPADLVRGFLLTPPDAEPGTVFAYNQPCTYTLGAIVARAAGTGLTDYLRPRLFDPLGIGPVAWARHRSGQELGFSGLYARTEDVAKLGLLYLQRGVWQGRQLIPAGWVAEATRAQVSTGVEGKPDWQQGYGFQFWRSRHGFRGDGAFGQFCVVLPDDDAVLAVTAATEDMQAVLDAAWEHLLPALRGGTDGPDADAELAARTAALHLPPVAAAPAPDVAARWDGFAARTAGPSPVSSVQVTALPGGQWRHPRRRRHRGAAERAGPARHRRHLGGERAGRRRRRPAAPGDQRRLDGAGHPALRRRLAADAAPHQRDLRPRRRHGRRLLGHHAAVGRLAGDVVRAARLNGQSPSTTHPCGSTVPGGAAGSLPRIRCAGAGSRTKGRSARLRTTTSAAPPSTELAR